MAFFDNVKFPFFTLQELNLDWLLSEVKRIAGFMPQGGNVGDVLTRKSDGAEWEAPAAVQVDIDSLPEDTQIMDNDQLIFYDISAQANRKIKPPNLLDSMCSNGTPYMNGTASAGTSKKPARYDHVHPTDTSRAPASYFQNNALKVANGGTGATTAAAARTNLGLGSIATVNSPVPVANGGTGATTAATARSNLGLPSVVLALQHDYDSITIGNIGAGQYLEGVEDFAIPTGMSFEALIPLNTNRAYPIAGMYLDTNPPAGYIRVHCGVRNTSNATISDVEARIVVIWKKTI